MEKLIYGNKLGFFLAGYFVVVLFFGMLNVVSYAEEAELKRNNSHIACEKLLQKMMGMEKTISTAVEQNKVDLLRAKLQELEADIHEVRGNMDKALLLGAWSRPDLKKSGHVLSDRLETIRILNFISLAFTSKYYANPVNKVSASVKDSVERFFVELDSLTEQVVRANKSI